MAKDKDEATEGAEDGGKGGKKKLIIIAAVVVAVLGAAGFMFLKPGGDAAAKEPKKGEVVVADSIHINLADGHFLKIGIALQVIEGPADEPDPSEALDATISLFSGKEIKEVEEPKKREGLKKELKKELEHAYHGDVMDVYFTEFVVQ